MSGAWTGGGGGAQTELGARSHQAEMRLAARGKEALMLIKERESV